MKRIETSFFVGHSKIREGEIEKKIMENIASEIIDNMKIIYEETDDPNIGIVKAYITIK